MSVDFAHGYSPPGVYIEEDPAPLVTATGLPPVRVAIVGRAVGYQSVKAEQITLGDIAVTLSQQGIVSGSITVKRVDDGTAVDPGDYSVVPAENAAFTQLSRAVDAIILNNTPVWVTYDYVDPSYFLPKTFSNFEDIKDAYGAPMNLLAQGPGQSSYEAVNSPLSLAAQCAMNNGAAEVVLVALDVPAEATSEEIKTALSVAYAKIATDYAVSIVVPLTDGIAEAQAAGVAMDLRTHLLTASDDGFLRTGFLGFGVGVTIAPDTLITTGLFASKRILLAYANPSGLSMYNGNANQTVTVGHQYLAAAKAGLAASLPVQKSLTHERVAGFSGISGTPLSNATKNQYAAAGVALTEIDRQGRMIVRHGTTTDRSNVSTSELSVVRARDTMVSLLQSGTEDSGLIGTPIDVNTPLSVKSVIAGLLEFCVSTATIVGYENLQVRQASVDPSVIEVKFGYRPAYPLNYILISFAINVSTGDTTLLEQAA